MGVLEKFQETDIQKWLFLIVKNRRNFFGVKNAKKNEIPIRICSNTKKPPEVMLTEILQGKGAKSVKNGYFCK